MQERDAAPIVDVPLSDEDVALALLTGFLRRDPDGVLAVTEKGGEWVREWCKKQALHEHISELTSDTDQS